MTSQAETIHIDRSEKKEVDKYIKSVFIYLKKYKTQDILNAYFNWYRSKPGRISVEVKEFDAFPRKNKEDFEKVNKVRTVDVVYGDKYAILLTKFVRANSAYETELIKVAQNLVVASKFEGRNNLGMSNLLSSFDVNLIKGIFKLLRNESGIVVVSAIPEKEPRLITKKDFNTSEDYSMSTFESTEFSDTTRTTPERPVQKECSEPVETKAKYVVATPSKDTNDDYDLKRKLYLENIKVCVSAAIEKTVPFFDMLFKSDDNNDDIKITKVIEIGQDKKVIVDKKNIDELSEQINSLSITSSIKYITDLQ